MTTGSKISKKTKEAKENIKFFCRYVKLNKLSRNKIKIKRSTTCSKLPTKSKKKIRATRKKKVNNLYLNKQKEEGVKKIPITSFRI